jgi:predicted ArsR family transcriptional regulator
MIESFGDTRRGLMATLLNNKGGLTIDSLCEALNVTRTAVRQHLATLERDGLVTRNGTRSTGGRPQLLYILTEAGQERFPRRYAWFADLLVGMLKEELGKEGLAAKLRMVGASLAATMRQHTATSVPLPERLRELATTMGDLGYETDRTSQNCAHDVVAHNCIFYRLAVAHPEVCEFDLGFMEKLADAKVDHVESMARGQHVCRFRFKNTKPSAPTSRLSTLSRRRT